MEDVSTEGSSDTQTLSKTAIGIIVGAGLLGAILILLAIIVIINIPFLVRKKRSNLESTLPHGNSSSSLLRQHPDPEDDGIQKPHCSHCVLMLLLWYCTDADRYNTHRAFSSTYVSAVNTLALPVRLQTQATSHQSSRDTRNLKAGYQNTHVDHYEMHQVQDVS